MTSCALHFQTGSQPSHFFVSYDSKFSGQTTLTVEDTFTVYAFQLLSLLLAFCLDDSSAAYSICMS